MALDLSSVWTYFADTSCGRYSPLYDGICRAVAADGRVLDLVREAPPHAHQPNVLLAAVHFLLLGGLDHPLADVYAGSSDADGGPLFVDLCLTHRAELLPLIAERRTNTNEVGRSAVIGPALTFAGRRHGSPIGLVDVGCSAGLNLVCDRYLLDYGTAGTTGPRDAPVRVASDTLGTPVPIAPMLPEIAARIGLDRAPVDLRNDDDVRWQLACVWPDTGRLPRTRRALDELRASPPTIVRGDAVDGIGSVVRDLPEHVLPVVVTTWVVAYLPPDRRRAFREALASISRERPVVWISAEGAGVVDAFTDPPPTDRDGMEASVLGMLAFRDGVAEPELLAFVHPHGNWIDWRAQA